MDTNTKRNRFAERLVAARQARGLTQLEAARISGVSRSLVAKLESEAGDVLSGAWGP